jgi:hypothetical protein
VPLLNISFVRSCCSQAKLAQAEAPAAKVAAIKDKENEQLNENKTPRVHQQESKVDVKEGGSSSHGGRLSARGSTANSNVLALPAGAAGSGGHKRTRSVQHRLQQQQQQQQHALSAKPTHSLSGAPTPGSDGGVTFRGGQSSVLGYDLGTATAVNGTISFRVFPRCLALLSCATPYFDRPLARNRSLPASRLRLQPPIRCVCHNCANREV